MTTCIRQMVLIVLISAVSAMWVMAGEMAAVSDRIEMEQEQEQDPNGQPPFIEDMDFPDEAKPEPPVFQDDLLSKTYQYLMEEVEDLSGRLDRIETGSILDKIIFSGEFRTRLEYLHYQDALVYSDMATMPEKRNLITNEAWSNRLRLNMRSDVTDNIIFHGRLSYYKLWGMTNYQPNMFDFNFASVPDTSGYVHVERAYIDYFVPGTPLSLSFGRLPASEGPPSELKDFTTRKGTWSKVMNDVEVDGIIATLALQEWTGLRNSFMRGGYAKVFQTFAGYGHDNLDQGRAFVALFEMEIPSIRNSILWLGYTRMNCPVPPMSIDALHMPDGLGHMEDANVLLQIQNFRDFGLDAFLSLTYLRMEPAARGISIADGYEFGMMCDSLNGNMGKTRESGSIYAGLRYRLPLPRFHSPALGVEYVYGSRYWTGLTSSGGGELINKIDIAGQAIEAYYIQPVRPNRMFCRIGSLFMDWDYISPFIMYGTRTQSDQTLACYYFLVDVRF